MKVRDAALYLFVIGFALFAIGVMPLYAQHGGEGHTAPHDSAVPGHDHHGGEVVSGGWEGSADGIAYSEQNHHIAGWMVILMGLAELSHAMRLPSLGWARLLLPAAMLFSGVFVMIWSDHEAWPIGSLTVIETFFGHDPEIIQHKAYGLMALAVGSVELFRRLGRMGHMAWATPLPLMAIVGGLMLFGHSHGVHPSAHKIAIHHAIMGTMAVTAGSSKLFSSWLHPVPGHSSSKWELLWAGLILLIGAQLLIYSE
jgi:putative copper resistance protein D